jgi:hypothetical protein
MERLGQGFHRRTERSDRFVPKLITTKLLDLVLELQLEKAAPESAAPLDRRQSHPHMRYAVFVLYG